MLLILPPPKLIWKYFDHQKSLGPVCFLPDTTQVKTNCHRMKLIFSCLRKTFSTVVLDCLKTQYWERTTSHRWISNRLFARMQLEICLTGENSDNMVCLRFPPQRYCSLHSISVGMQKQGCLHFYLKSHSEVLYCVEMRAIGRQIR